MFNTQRDEHEYIQAFLRWEQAEGTWCLGTRGPKNDIQTPYIPFSTLETYLKGERVVERLLDALYPDGDAPVADYVRNYYLRPFAILLSISHGHLINQFTKHEDLQDRKLPFRRQPQKFPASGILDLWSAFSERQWKFCPVMLQYNMESELDENEILPLQLVKQVGTGGTSDVHMVKVHRQYNRLSSNSANHLTASSQQADTFVFKTYRGREAEEYYRTERNAFMRLRDDGQPPANIVCFYGSFVRDHTFTLILEYADGGTLEQFMADNPSPSNGEDILILWKRLFGLFPGLARIHHTEKADDGPRIMLGWHQDIKPENILVRTRKSTSIYDCDFLIADLGLSHFKRLVGQHQDTADGDTVGAYVYGAPETFRCNYAIETLALRVGRQVDVWSLGCVFSEVATWIVHGRSTLQEYRRLRKLEASKALKSDQSEIFHNGQQALSVVEKSHTNVMKSCRKDDFITERVLQGPVNDMLKSEDRKDVLRLYGQADEIVRTAESKLQKSIDQEYEETSPIENARLNLCTISGTNSIEVQPEQSAAASPPISANFQNFERSAKLPNGAPVTCRKDPPPPLSLADALKYKMNKKGGRKADLPNKELLSDLKNMDHIFLIDNTATMANHRTNLEEVVGAMSYLVKDLDPDGMEMFFTTSENSIRGCKKTTTLLNGLKHAHFAGKSNMGARLGQILSGHEMQLNGQRDKRRGIIGRFRTSDPYRRLSIYVLTDGMWQPGSDVSAVIKSMVTRLEQVGLLKKHHMGIQFIRFGEDPYAIELLKHLDDGLGLPLDIVDTTSAKGSIWKMLLGATNTWFDDYDEGDVQQSNVLGAGTSAVPINLPTHHGSTSQKHSH